MRTPRHEAVGHYVEHYSAICLVINKNSNFVQRLKFSGEIFFQVQNTADNFISKQLSEQVLHPFWIGVTNNLYESICTDLNKNPCEINKKCDDFYFA